MKKLTALLLLLPFLASADPGAITKLLMTEPASMFELGMTRLEIGLNNLTDDAQQNYLGKV